jgi:ribose 5-phosphate isomerase B
VHYPIYGKKVVDAILSRAGARGILICGTGLGMSVIANRFPGIRAALCYDIFTAIMSRRHNNANLLVLGGRVTGPDLAKEIVRVWLTTPFEGGRHQERLDLLERLAAGKPT